MVSLGAFGAMLRHFLACVRGEARYQGATPQEAQESLRVARWLMEDSQREERAP